MAFFLTDLLLDMDISLILLIDSPHSIEHCNIYISSLLLIPAKDITGIDLCGDVGEVGVVAVG